MELIRKKFPYCDLTMSRSSMYEESTDAIVPDSYPDIGRIIGAEGMVSVKDETPQNDRVLISGTIKVVVIYMPDGETMPQRIEVPLSFAHIEECKGITADCACFVRCQMASAEARAVNSRKVAVTAKLCIETCIYEKKTFSATEEVSDSSMPLEILYDTHTIALPVEAAAREFTILDDIELPGGESLELLTMDCALRQSECRAMPGKLLLRGEAILTGLALDENGGFQSILQPIGFSQVVEMEGIAEGQPLQVRLAVRNLDCMLSEQGVLSIGIGARVLAMQETVCAIRTIKDLYQTGHELSVQAKPCSITAETAVGELSAEGSETVSIGIKPGQCLSVRAICADAQVENADTLRISADMRLLYLDEAGEPYSYSRRLSLPLKTAVPLEGTTVRDIRLTAVAIPAGEDGVTVRVSAVGNQMKRDTAKWNDISQIEIGEPKPDLGSVTLILRAAEEGESLWDIAKQYSTTVTSICAANQIADDQQNVHARMLLIPVGER